MAVHATTKRREETINTRLFCITKSASFPMKALWLLRVLLAFRGMMLKNAGKSVMAKNQAAIEPIPAIVPKSR